jgi:NADH:ubiquinone reductase (non-electrogenic)
LMAKLPEHQTQRRGLVVDEHMRLLGAPEIFALGDCTATSYAPTAQAASQQGVYLARTFAKMGQAEKLRNQLNEMRQKKDSPVEEVERTVKRLNKALDLPPFHYSHQGSLAYIGSEKAIADLPFFNGNFASGG